MTWKTYKCWENKLLNHDRNTKWAKHVSAFAKKTGHEEKHER